MTTDVTMTNLVAQNHSHHLLQLLDICEETFRNGERVDGAMTTLFSGLWEARQLLPVETWLQWAQFQCRRHPIIALLRQAPMIDWALRRPRGYPGDAVLLDMIYKMGGERERNGDGALGSAIMSYLVDVAPSARAVRARSNYLTHLIDQTAQKTEQPHILSLACGHLREASNSIAVTHRQIGRFIAADTDPQSLDVVTQELGRYGVCATKASARDLILGKQDLGLFDLIYSAGLYDYLSDSQLITLNTTLFSMLKPGGQLLVANFAPHLPDVGYMECCMDWWLIYRDEERLLATFDGIPVRERTLEHFRDDGQMIVFASCRKG